MLKDQFSMLLKAFAQSQSIFDTVDSGRAAWFDVVNLFFIEINCQLIVYI